MKIPDELVKRYAAVADKLVAAGWATQTLCEPNGFSVQYTDLGIKRARQLVQIYCELQLGTLDAKEIGDLAEFVFLTTAL